MKNFKLFLSAAAVVALAACSPAAQSTQNNDTNTDAGVAKDSVVAQPLFAKLSIKDNIKTGDSVLLKFTIYNTADSVQQFCKWHTPFEPLMSKYLDVTDEKGQEADYRGAMAKRIMPPPADSYVKVNPGDSLSINVDVLKGYAIKNPGKYTIKYNAQNMSGLVVKDSVSFVYGK